MAKPRCTAARELAQAASLFQAQRTGHMPKAVSVVLSDTTLVVTLHEALSPAERALARRPGGAARVEEFHRQIFTHSSDSLGREIRRITGVEMHEAAAEIEPTCGAVVRTFTTGATVHVFLLVRPRVLPLTPIAWSGDAAGLGSTLGRPSKTVRRVRDSSRELVTGRTPPSGGQSSWSTAEGAGSVGSLADS